MDVPGPEDVVVGRREDKKRRRRRGEKLIIIQGRLLMESSLSSWLLLLYYIRNTSGQRKHKDLFIRSTTERYIVAVRDDSNLLCSLFCCDVRDYFTIFRNRIWNKERKSRSNTEQLIQQLGLRGNNYLGGGSRFENKPEINNQMTRLLLW